MTKIIINITDVCSFLIMVNFDSMACKCFHFHFKAFDKRIIRDDPLPTSVQELTEVYLVYKLLWMKKINNCTIPTCVSVVLNNDNIILYLLLGW